MSNLPPGYYFIKKIEQRRKIGGKFEYLVKWKGYDISQNTWYKHNNTNITIQI